MDENKAIPHVKKSIFTFVILNFALSSIFYYLIIFSGVGGLTTLLLMWCPAIAAIITSLIFFRSIKGFGWGPGKIKYLILGYIIPIIYAIIAYGLFWILSLGTFTGDLPSNIILFIIIGTISGIISALGEEIGWRGFLVPQLAKLTTFSWVALVSGVIWALWHFPVIIFSNYNSSTPLWYALPLFFVGTLGVSFILAWLRLKSGSIWPAVLFHASHNLFIQQFFDPLSSGALTKYLVGETGIILVAIIIIFALVFWIMRDKLPDIRITFAQS